VSELETFKNDRCVVEATRGDNCAVHFKVTLSPDVASKCHKKAIKLTNKRISIPGFRKGKAPDASVLERYPTHIEQEFREKLIEEAFEQALSLSKIYPIRKESITPPKIVRASTEEGAEITFSFEITPKVPVIEFSKIRLAKVVERPIDEKQYEEIIEQVRASHATYEKEAENRPVQEGDFIDLTINSILEDGQVHPVVVERRFKVGEQMQDWLRSLVVGMHVGEVRKTQIDPNWEITQEEKERIQKSSFSVELLALYTTILPEFDDTLAQKMGAQTKEEAIEKIRHNLKQRALYEQQQEEIASLESELLRLYPLDLPSCLIQEEKKERIKNRIVDLKRMKLSDERILERQKEIEEEIHDEVVRTLRLYFLNQQIAKQGQISVSKEEFNTLLAREITERPHLYQKDVSSEELGQRVQQLRALAHQRKIEEFALEQVRTSSCD
jgi:trigger factor